MLQLNLPLTRREYFRVNGLYDADPDEHQGEIEETFPEPFRAVPPDYGKYFDTGFDDVTDE